MNKAPSRLAITSLICLSAACALLVATGAVATTVDGKWGIGFEETLTGIPDPSDADSAFIAIPASGLAIHHFRGNVNFEAVLGGRAHLGSSSATEWAGFLALGAHYAKFRSPRANLSAGLRVVLGLHRPVDAATQAASALRLGVTVEVPLRAVFFLSDQFLIAGAVGPVAAFETASGNPLTGGSSALKVNLFKGGFSGGLGFAFLFG